MSSGINNNPVRGGNINNLTAKYEYWTVDTPHHHTVTWLVMTLLTKPAGLFVIIGLYSVPVRIVKLPV